jgi:4-amino-4-deoxy-L-arabinose transferase-like glycosyltransferase
MRKQLLVVLAVVLALRLPFLNQAVQGDDPNYLVGAMHAQIDPVHPNHVRYVFLGDVVDMRGHPHPPLNAWCLGALLAVFGDIREIPFHAAYLLFSLVAALAMWWLARRFTEHALLATLLFLATPAFVVNGTSFEADLPLLAFWMASAALFVKAVDARSVAALAAAAVALTLACFSAYQAVLLVPILAVYGWPRWRSACAALLAGPAALLLWQVFERLSSGTLPATVLVGYFQTYGFQALTAKLRSAAALTAHTGWLVFPLLAWTAFAGVGRRWLIATAAAAAAAAYLDPHPLFWLSFGTGLLVLVASWREQERFLRAWVGIFFSAALVLFFAGSARYLLPMAAPVALMVTRRLARKPRWLGAACAAQFALSLSLAWVNYEHGEGYRAFAAELRPQSEKSRLWINGEWGLSYYLETEGGLRMVRGQAVRPGDYVVSSRLAYPIPFTTGGGTLALVAERTIGAALPLRLIGLGAQSAYSTSALGLRPFDISDAPIDVVRAEVVIQSKPELEYVSMNAPQAARQIVSGIYDLEENRWRWMGEKGVLLLKTPPRPKPLEVTFFIPPAAPGRQVTLLLDGVELARATYAKPDTYTLRSRPASGSALTIAIDKGFSVPGDHRRLGLILAGAGFK